jgi:hypothetical protein
LPQQSLYFLPLPQLQGSSGLGFLPDFPPQDISHRIVLHQNLFLNPNSPLNGWNSPDLSQVEKRAKHCTATFFTTED